MSSKHKDGMEEDAVWELQEPVDLLCNSEQGVHIGHLHVAHEFTGEQQVLKLILAKGPIGEALAAGIAHLMDGNTVELQPTASFCEVGAEVTEPA